MYKLAVVFLFLFVTGCTYRDIEKKELVAVNPSPNSEETKIRKELEKFISIEYVGLYEFHKNDEHIRFSLKNDSPYEIRELEFTFKIFSNGKMIFDSALEPEGIYIPNTPPFTKIDSLSFTPFKNKDSVYDQIKSSSNISVKIDKIYPVKIKKDSKAIPLYRPFLKRSKEIRLLNFRIY